MAKPIVMPQPAKLITVLAVELILYSRSETFLIFFDAINLCIMIDEFRTMTMQRMSVIVNYTEVAH